ncbi:MAG: DUF368 domain-containing protein [Clostridia bacterium]|nr:DUF368 domain-containing protein [Clostridia bacterium]
MQATKNENSIGSIFYRVFVGILFGFANVIPGVSGGTVMVVLGVYERIIGIITDFRHKIKTEWKFFLPIIVGMGIAIFVFGMLMSKLLNEHKEITQMFFIGVIVFSVPGIFKSAAFGKDKKLNIKPQYIIAFVLVLALMVFMATSSANDEKARIKAEREAAKAQTTETAAGSDDTGAENVLPGAAGEENVSAAAGEENANVSDAAPTSGEKPAYTPDHSVWALLLNVVYGAIACATMIIPGISGSLVMVMLGQYQKVMDAIANLDIITLLPFGIGCLIGLIFCAKLIKWLLSKHSQLAYSAILGFVTGSILSVFPGWSAVISLGGIIAFLIGGACIIGCEMLSRKFAK